MISYFSNCQMGNSGEGVDFQWVRFKSFILGVLSSRFLQDIQMGRSGNQVEEYEFGGQESDLGCVLKVWEQR